MAIDYASIGKRVKYYRTKANLSQEELGEIINISRKHISLIEIGSSTPSLDALIDIANALGVSADDLLVDVSVNPPRGLREPRNHARILQSPNRLQWTATESVREIGGIGTWIRDCKS